MPLFFCISGYLYVCKSSFITYSLKKIKSLWIPFVTSSLITYLVFVVLGMTAFSLKEIVKIILMFSTGPLLGATWFIPVLIFTNIIYELMTRGLKKIKFIKKEILKDLTVHDIISTFVCVVCLIIGICISLPHQGSVILRSLFFFQIGQITKKYFRCYKYDLYIGVVLLVILTIVSFFNKSSYLNNNYTYVSLFIISSISGSIGVCLLCRYIDKKIDIGRINSITYIGRISMGPLIWQFVSFKIVIIIQILYYRLPYEKILDFPVIYDYANGIWVFLDVIAGIYISIIIYNLINKPIDSLANKIIKRVAY